MFTNKTFKYLRDARKNEMDLEWFEENKKDYVNFVKKPMAELIVKIWEQFDDELPGIKIDPSRVSRPTRIRKNNPENKPVVKSQSSFYFAVPPTSRFEWNPGIYFKIGPNKDEIELGAGLYHVSSRQTKKMRFAVTDKFEEFDAILSNPALKRRFGSLTGDTYQRYPRGLDENHPASKYLVHKEFHLKRTYRKDDLLDKNFMKVFIKDVGLLLPFFKWIREEVGLYRYDKMNFGTKVHEAPSSFLYSDEH